MAVEQKGKVNIKGDWTPIDITGGDMYVARGSEVSFWSDVEIETAPGRFI